MMITENVYLVTTLFGRYLISTLIDVMSGPMINENTHVIKFKN